VQLKSPEQRLTSLESLTNSTWTLINLTFILESHRNSIHLSFDNNFVGGQTWISKPFVSSENLIMGGPKGFIGQIYGFQIHNSNIQRIGKKSFLRYNHFFCLACLKKFEGLITSRLLLICPNNCIFCSSSTTCTQCITGYGISGGLCVYCDSGKYSDGTTSCESKIPFDCLLISSLYTSLQGLSKYN